MTPNGLPQFAYEVVNVVEDKRCNYFGKNRYRFDLGKRQELKELIFKDMIETNIPEYIAKAKKNSLIVGAYLDKALYNVDISPILARLEPAEVDAVNFAIETTEKLKYARLRIDVVNGYKAIYDKLRPFLTNDEDGYGQLTATIDGGQIKGDISKALAQALTQIAKAEQKAEQQLDADLKKGSGAGEGTGLEIPAPDPDFSAYSQMVDRNKPYIERLLNKLKRLIRPQTQRAVYQNRGRIMSPILARAYVSSLQRQVNNIYVKNTVVFEKQKVNIGFLFDYSGSVPREQAEDITTTLNEVFGHWVEDYGFAIAVFGDNNQKVKTFFETFQNTKARIGNITVSASGTRIHDLAESFLKMFNSIHEQRRKILVVASDFEFCDEAEAEEVIEQYAKAGIELLFIGFGSCSNVKTFARKVKAKRTSITNVEELPERFLEVYLNEQK
jgi:flagellar hook-basal body complex protein FliE